MRKHLHTQHTPNPSAQSPLDFPPCIRHSYTFRHVPIRNPSSDMHSSSLGIVNIFKTVQTIIKKEKKIN